MAESEPLDQLRLLADCLAKGKHSLSVKLVRPFPVGLWTCYDGREILFDSARHPIWQQRYRKGPVESADRYERVKNVAWREVIFDDRLPYQPQYEAMKRLRSILAGWGLIPPNRAEQQYWRWQQRTQRIRRRQCLAQQER